MTDIPAGRATIALPSNRLVRVDAQIGGKFVNAEDFLCSASRHYLDYLQAGAVLAIFRFQS